MFTQDVKNVSIKRIGFVLGGIVLVLFLVISFVNFNQHSLGLSGKVSVASAPVFDGDTTQIRAEEMMQNTARYDDGGLVEKSIIPEPIDAPPSGEVKLIKKGNLTLLVDNVDQTAKQITDLRSALNGQQGNASFNEYRPGVRTGNMTIWVPSEHFDEAMAKIKSFAIRVENENISTNDVSAQYVDLASRLKNLEATETQLVEIMKRAGSIKDVLDVSRELSNTRSQIEQLKGQLNYLSQQVALSSIYITLTQEAVPTAVTNEWRPISVFKSAVKSTLNDLTHFADMLIVFFVRLPIMLLQLAFWVFLFWILWKLGKFVYVRMNKSMGTTTPSSPNK